MYFDYINILTNFPVALTSAPFFKRTSATSLKPFSQQICSGVLSNYYSKVYPQMIGSINISLTSNKILTNPESALTFAPRLHSILTVSE